MEDILEGKKFISFEGGEGSGKTTVIEYVRDHLVDNGYEVLITREPGGINIAEQIREVILDKNNTEMDYMTEVFLYAAARREHLVHKVFPALEEGKVVLCDRYVDSSLVYQGYSRGLGIDKVKEINEYVTGGVMPDKTFYLDVSPEIGLARIDVDENREKNRLDLEELKFHEKVREGYLRVVERYPERLDLIDANKDVEGVLAEILNRLGD